MILRYLREINVIEGWKNEWLIERERDREKWVLKWKRGWEKIMLERKEIYLIDKEEECVL